MRQALVILVACVACGIDRTVLVGAEPAPGVVGGPGIVVVPDAATFPNDAFAVFAGQQYSCALLGGRGWCWGRNNFGALGTGDTILRTTPTPVSGSTSFDTLALGENHTCGIEHGTGRVWCWGYGARGQLGLGTKDSALAPSPVPLPAPAVRLTTGYEHACAILATGALHCWGANGEGQLGLSDGIGGPDVASPTPVGTETDWIDISGGQGHTCGIRAPGVAWCWGRNIGGQLGLGTGRDGQIRTPTRVDGPVDLASIELGQDASVAVTRGGRLLGWGSGDDGLDGTGQVLWSPTAIGTMAGWSSVATDVFTSCALSQDRHLSCWGRNAEGQLGLDDFTDRPTPTLTGGGGSFVSFGVGRFHVCAVTAEREVACAGKNEMGEVGVGDLDHRTTFTRLVFGRATR